ncbi:hypothetical protein AS593_07210 [Caulobacter vibrioides]|nr:hypothetical protein AS593_07210 [Caulobacter vibrioides]
MVLGAVLVAATLALVSAWGLASLARPVDLEDRLEAVTAMQARTERLSAGRGSSTIYPAEAVCRSTEAADLAAARQRLEAMAAGAGLTHPRVKVALAAPEFGDPLTPVRFTVEAGGSYAGAVGLMETLRRGPMLTQADAVDLRGEDGSVRFTLEGRFYCWTAVSR